MRTKVHSEELIGAAEGHPVLGLHHPTSVTTYLKRHTYFPRPVAHQNESRFRLWLRQDVIEWQRAREAKS